MGPIFFRMELRLTKTFLSKRLSSGSFLISIISLGLLALFFSSDPKEFYANADLVFNQKQYWRLFTTTLLHADLNHLAHNSFFFIGLSYLLHSYFGFWVFPILSLTTGGLINLMTLHYYPPLVYLVGISGVIYFMASFWLTLYLLIERRQKIIKRFIHAMGISLIFFFPQVFSPETSYLAHGIGFLIGIPIGILYFFINFRKIRASEEWTEVIKDSTEIQNLGHEETDYNIEESH